MQEAAETAQNTPRLMDGPLPDMTLQSSSGCCEPHHMFTADADTVIIWRCMWACGRIGCVTPIMVCYVLTDNRGKFDDSLESWCRYRTVCVEWSSTDDRPGQDGGDIWNTVVHSQSPMPWWWKSQALSWSTRNMVRQYSLVTHNEALADVASMEAHVDCVWFAGGNWPGWRRKTSGILCYSKLTRCCPSFGTTILQPLHSKTFSST